MNNQGERPWNHFFIAIIGYIVFVSIATVILLGYFQKIKAANEKYREKMVTYLNWRFEKDKALEIGTKSVCEGDIFFQAQSPIAAIQVYHDQLYLSQANGKLTVVDLKNPKLFSSYEGNLFTDFYANPSELFATEIINNRIVRISFIDNKIKIEEVYDKIGRASALTRNANGDFFVTGYASGNITKIVGRDGFLFASDLDKISDLEIRDKALYVARYNSKPSLLKLTLEGGEKTVIEENKSFSSLVSSNNVLWIISENNGQAEISQIIEDKLVGVQSLNCPFPLKIAFWEDKIFYTSLVDNEGKIYSLKNNLQITGR